jgi:hypothetical protein
MVDVVLASARRSACASCLSGCAHVSVVAGCRWWWVFHGGKLFGVEVTTPPSHSTSLTLTLTLTGPRAAPRHGVRPQPTQNARYFLVNKFVERKVRTTWGAVYRRAVLLSVRACVHVLGGGKQAGSACLTLLASARTASAQLERVETRPISTLQHTTLPLASCCRTSLFLYCVFSLSTDTRLQLGRQGDERRGPAAEAEGAAAGASWFMRAVRFGDGR